MTTKRKSSAKAKTDSKDAEPKKIKTASRGRKKSTTASPKPNQPNLLQILKKIKEAEVDSKVREIISKSVQNVKSDESEKKESRAFTLDDVAVFFL